MQNHNDDTIKTGDTVLRKIYLSLYWKGCVWEGVGDRTELQHIDPHSIGHNRVSFPFIWAAQSGAWGPSLSGCWFSLLHLICNSSDPQLLNRGPGGSLCWVLAFSTASWLQLVCSPNWLPVFTELYNTSTPILLPVGITNCTHSTHPRSRLYSIPRLDAPVIYIGAFPILTARPGRRSIYSSCVR